MSNFVENLNKANKDQNMNVYLSDDYLYEGFFQNTDLLGKVQDLDSVDTIILWAQDIKDNLPTLYLRIRQAVKNGKKIVNVT